MPNEEKMTIDERFKYLRLMKRQYVKASGAERGRLLDDMGRMTGLHRKSLIRLMSGSLERKPRHRQRGRTYGPEVDDALRVISDSFDHICAERLQPNLVWMATHLAQHGEMEASQPVLDQLSQISLSTVRRILTRLRQDEHRLPRKGPAQANRVAREIPMKRIPWNEPQPGHFEVDAVHHCGISSAGHYVHTVQMVDVATGWTEQVATLGRSYRVMEDGFRRILARLPFQVLEIHPDNGSEFLNAHLVRFWKEKVKGVALSRSRPFSNRGGGSEEDDGDQGGGEVKPGVSGEREAMVRVSRLKSLSEAWASRLPSGDQKGLTSCTSLSVSCTRPEPSECMTQIL